MKASDWIKVEDRLPEMNQKVLVVARTWNNDPFVDKAMYQSRGWTRSSVTHWMPIVLPEE